MYNILDSVTVSRFTTLVPHWCDIKVKVNTGSKHIGYVEGSGLLQHFKSIQGMKNKTPQ